MRQQLLVPLLILTLACGGKLDRGKAEDLLGREYPVRVPVLVPEQAYAEKGSPEHLRLQTLKKALDGSGWFATAVVSSDTADRFSFRLKPGAPDSIKAAPKGFSMPAAEAVFVRAVRMEPTREGARVTYEIRLERPTAQFPVFLALHPEARAGQTKQRHATFERRRGTWTLTGTDEAFHKAE